MLDVLLLLTRWLDSRMSIMLFSLVPSQEVQEWNVKTYLKRTRESSKFKVRHYRLLLNQKPKFLLLVILPTPTQPS